MRIDTERRLERLEALKPGKPATTVLVAQNCDEARVLADYEARTPEDERAELVVILRRFTEVRA